jgi:hypothetical protein
MSQPATSPHLVSVDPFSNRLDTVLVDFFLQVLPQRILFYDQSSTTPATASRIDG